MIVAEVTQPSLGVGYEIGRAVELNKPIITLFRPSSGRSKFCLVFVAVAVVVAVVVVVIVVVVVVVVVVCVCVCVCVCVRFVRFVCF